MRYRRANAAGGTYFFTVNLAERRSDLLVRHIDDLRAAMKTVKERTSVCYSGDGGVARTPACDMALAAGRCRLSATLVTHQGRVSRGGWQKANTFEPVAKPSVSAAFGSGGIGNIKSGMRLILRGTSITFITIP